MKFTYSVISAEPIDEQRCRIVLDVKSSQVINGYGGGKLTFEVSDDAYEDEIKQKVYWKFTQQTALPPVESVFEFLSSDLSKLEAIVEPRKEARRAAAEAEAARVEAELREAQRLEDERRQAALVAEPPVEPGV